MKPGRTNETGERSADGTVRLDKWLWAARFYRTRSLAAQAIEAGQVRINGERAKPAHSIRATSRVSVRKGKLTFDVEVLDVSDRRGPASIAARLYRETPESAAAREAMLHEHRAGPRPGVSTADQARAPKARGFSERALACSGLRCSRAGVSRVASLRGRE